MFKRTPDEVRPAEIESGGPSLKTIRLAGDRTGKLPALRRKFGEP